MTHAGPVGQPDAEAALEFESAATRPVGWSFLALYTPGLHEHQPGVPGAAPVVLAIGNASYRRAVRGRQRVRHRHPARAAGPLSTDPETRDPSRYRSGESQ